MIDLSGTGVALVTPFKNGKVDFDALTKIVEHVIHGGVDYLVALGTTGESATLSEVEQRQVLDHILKVNDQRKPIVAGNFGGNDTAALCTRIKHYNFSGIDAILSSSPAYNKPTQEGIYRHYMAIAEVSPIPVILYNVPGRTGSHVLPTTTIRIAKESQTVAAIKDASGNIDQGAEIIQAGISGFTVLSGDDPTALSLVQAGGRGAISVVANLFPEIFSSMITAAINGDNQSATALNDQLADLHPLLYEEGNPSGIKAAMSAIGLCESELRLPLVAASDSLKSMIKLEVERINSL